MDIYDNRFLYDIVVAFRTRHFREESGNPARFYRFRTIHLLVNSGDWSVETALRRLIVTSGVVDDQ